MLERKSIDETSIFRDRSTAAKYFARSEGNQPETSYPNCTSCSSLIVSELSSFLSELERKHFPFERSWRGRVDLMAVSIFFPPFVLFQSIDPSVTQSVLRVNLLFLTAAIHPFVHIVIHPFACSFIHLGAHSFLLLLVPKFILYFGINSYTPLFLSSFIIF